MTDTEINIAIAEVMGFTHIEPGPYDGHPFGIEPGETKPFTKVRCPNYCADLNAMHDAERSLQPEQLHKWVSCLNKITEQSQPDCCGVCKWTALIRATARQRAEAFLGTLGSGRKEVR